jgi:hypothetical protein
VAAGRLEHTRARSGNPEQGDYMYTVIIFDQDYHDIRLFSGLYNTNTSVNV